MKCKCTPAIASFLWLASRRIETKEARPSLLCNTAGWSLEADGESMNCSDEKPDLTNVAVEPLQRGWTMLCSLRIVPVTSEHFLGRRYVMELATASRARELRVFRSLEQLMSGVEELGLRAELREDLQRQLVEEGCCQLLDIVL